MVNKLIEALGFSLIIAAAYFVWPPAALLVGGLVLLLVANVRAARKITPGPGLLERLVRAALASKAEPK